MTLDAPVSRGRQASIQHPAEQVVALIAAFAVGFRYTLPMSLTPAVLISVALLPVWIGSLRRYRWAVGIFAGAAVAIASGLFLALWTTEYDSYSSVVARGYSMEFLALIGGIGVLLWSRTLLGTEWMVLAYAFGWLASVSPNPINPWKFGFAVPTTFLLLAVAAMLRRWWLDLVVLMGLSAASALNDSRSYFAILLLTAVAVIWQRVAAALPGRSKAMSLTALVLLALTVYQTAIWLISSGRLGAAAAARSEAQAEMSGSVLLGGRPEIAATFALFREYPMGFGLGRVPSLTEILVAKEGMFSIGYDPNNGYVERYLFGSGYELHSLFGDFWARLGLIGLLWIVLLLVALVPGVVSRLAVGRAPALLILPTILFLWNFAFSPLYSSIPATIAVVAIALQVKVRNEDDETVGEE